MNVSFDCDIMATLKTILENATRNFFQSDYTQAASLYEEALTLIGTDRFLSEYNLCITDVCVIRYSLCSCYITNKQCFEKAANELIPLVISYGNVFPTLYYGLAKLCLAQRCYQRAESVINNCLKALNDLPENKTFNANWPGTDIEIPESNCNVLIGLLQSLKKQCVAVNNMADSEIYQSDEGDSDDTRSQEENTDPENNETEEQTLIAGSLPEETSNQNELFKKNNDAKHMQAVEDISHMKKKCTTVLNANVAEFVPRNLRNSSFILDNSLVIPSVVSDPETNNIPPKPEEDSIVSSESVICNDISDNSLSVCIKDSQTCAGGMVDKAVDMTIEHISVTTQTDDSMQPITNTQETEEKHQMLGKLVSLMEENKKLRKEMNTIQQSFLQKLLQSEQKVNAAETSAQIVSVRLEACREVLEEKKVASERKIKVQKSKIEDLRKTNKTLNSMITSQTMQHFNFKRRVVIHFISKCKKMISDITNALPYLSARSVPTIAECHVNIKKWQEQVKEAEDYLVLLNRTCEQALTDIRVGNFTEMANLPELDTPFTESYDILHDSFVPTLNISRRENLLHYQQNMQHYQQNLQYQQEYSKWWNTFGVTQQPRPVAALPQYYNVPNGSPNIRITDVTSSSNSINLTAGRPQNQNPDIPHPEHIQNNNLTESAGLPEEHFQESMNSSSISSSTRLEHEETEVAGAAVELFEQVRNPEGGKARSELETGYGVPGINETEQTDSTSTLDQTLPEAYRPINPFTISSKNTIIHNSILDEVEQDSAHLLDEASNRAISNGLNNGLPGVQASKPDNSNTDPNKVFHFQGTFDDTKIESTQQHPFSFIVSDNFDNPAPSSSRTSNTNDAGMVQDSPRIVEKVKKTIDYSQLPDAVRKAGRSFCDLYVYAIDEVPQKTGIEIFAGLKRVRRKNTKLSGMTKEAIVAALRIELKVDPEPEGYMVGKTQEAERMLSNCIVCLEPFGSLALAELQCRHTFHKKCITQWLIYKNDCPVCRILVV